MNIQKTLETIEHVALGVFLVFAVVIAFMVVTS